MADWYEELPDGCPPADAWAPPEGKAFFRLVGNNPPTEADFMPLATEHPDRKVSAAKACEAMAISLRDNIDEAHALLKLPTQRGKQVVQLALTGDAGVVKQTGRNCGHHSWWRSSAFDAPAAARLIA